MKTFLPVKFTVWEGKPCLSRRCNFYITIIHYGNRKVLPFNFSVTFLKSHLITSNLQLFLVCSLPKMPQTISVWSYLITNRSQYLRKKKPSSKRMRYSVHFFSLKIYMTYVLDMNLHLIILSFFFLVSR